MSDGRGLAARRWEQSGDPRPLRGPVKRRADRWRVQLCPADGEPRPRAVAARRSSPTPGTYSSGHGAGRSERSPGVVSPHRDLYRGPFATRAAADILLEAAGRTGSSLRPAPEYHHPAIGVLSCDPLPKPLSRFPYADDMSRSSAQDRSGPPDSVVGWPTTGPEARRSPSSPRARGCPRSASTACSRPLGQSCPMGPATGVGVDSRRLLLGKGTPTPPWSIGSTGLRSRTSWPRPVLSSSNGGRAADSAE
jgi:hypothetical protein